MKTKNPATAENDTAGVPDPDKDGVQPNTPTPVEDEKPQLLVNLREFADRIEQALDDADDGDDAAKAVRELLPDYRKQVDQLERAINVSGPPNPTPLRGGPSQQSPGGSA